MTSSPSQQSERPLIQVGFAGAAGDLEALIEFAEARGMEFVWGDYGVNDGWPAEWDVKCQEVERLREANDRLSQVLRVIAEAHHGTVTPSKLHAPDDQGFDDCPALTCKAARDALAAMQQTEKREENQ